jgi:hypothetical protein
MASQLLNKTTKLYITGGMTLGGVVGLYSGYHQAKMMCFVKHNLTPIEFAGEVICAGTITGGMAFAGAYIGALYALTSPISIPVTYYVMQENR